MLSSVAVRQAITQGLIEVTPTEPGALRENTVRLHLGPFLRWYTHAPTPRSPGGDGSAAITIPPEGTLLHPGTFYLGATVEHTRCAPTLQPLLTPTADIVRLGVDLRWGFGDPGFAGYWTLAFSVSYPIVVQAGAEIAALQWSAVEGPTGPTSRVRRYDASTPKPQPSRGLTADATWVAWAEQLRRSAGAAEQ